MPTMNPVPLPVTEADGANTTLGTTTDAAAASDTASTTYIGLFKRLLQRVTTLIGVMPASLGQKTMANSSPVSIASDQSSLPTTVGDGGNTTLGAKADTAAPDDNSTAASVVAILRRNLQRFTTLLSLIPATLGPAAPSSLFGVTMPNDVQVVGATATAINTDLLSGTVSGWYDAALFHSVSFSVITTSGITAGVVTFEQTNDTTNAANGVVLEAFQSDSLSANPVTSLTLAASTVKQFEAPLMARYFRVRISTGVTGGTVLCTAVFSQLPYAATRINAQQATAANLNVTSIGTATLTTSSGTNSTTLSRNTSLVATGVTMKSGAGRLHHLAMHNTSASGRYVKIYNKSSPTVGTDTPAMTYYLPPTSSFSYTSDLGLFFSIGIGIAATQLVGDSDTTAPSANDVLVNFQTI